MSKYTMQLRNIIHLVGRQKVISYFTNYNLEDFLTPSQIESISKTGVWSKEKLAEKIIDHYYMQEIGFETIELFRINVKSLMQELIEEKLPIIYSNSLSYDPLINVDFKETFERELSGNSNSNSNSSGTSHSSSSSSSEDSTIAIENKTPQTRINKQDLSSGAYASNVNQAEGNSNASGLADSTTTQLGESSQNSASKEKYTRTQKGNSGSLTTAQALVMQYRKAIYAVDKEIIESLAILFMGVF